MSLGTYINVLLEINGGCIALIVAFNIFVHPQNASSPMLETELPIVTDVRPLQPQNVR